MPALALGAARARDVPKVATGFVADIALLGDLRLRPRSQRNLAETTDAMPGVGLLTWAMDLQVDRARKDVTVTLFGIGRSHAVYREGLGCTLDHGQGMADVALPPDDRQPALLPEIAGPRTRAAAKRRACPPRWIAPSPSPCSRPIRRTRAIVVMKEGRIIAERYADGIGSRRRCSASP